jgi:hypothetical protein
VVNGFYYGLISCSRLRLPRSGIALKLLLLIGSEDDDWTPARLKRRDNSDDEDEEETKPTVGGLKRGRKSLKTPDTRELFRFEPFFNCTLFSGEVERLCQIFCLI